MTKQLVGGVAVRLPSSDRLRPRHGYPGFPAGTDRRHSFHLRFDRSAEPECRVAGDGSSPVLSRPARHSALGGTGARHLSQRCPTRTAMAWSRPVMLPLQHGLLLTTDRPFFPADVAAALIAGTPGLSRGRRRPGVLVTTPVHLRRWSATPRRPPQVPVSARRPARAFVLSATAPLSADWPRGPKAHFPCPGVRDLRLFRGRSTRHAPHGRRTGLALPHRFPTAPGCRRHLGFRPRRGRRSARRRDRTGRRW